MDWPRIGLAAVAILPLGVSQAKAGILALDAGLPGASEVTANSPSPTGFAQTLLADVAKFGTREFAFQGASLTTTDGQIRGPGIPGFYGPVFFTLADFQVSTPGVHHTVVTPE